MLQSMRSQRAGHGLVTGQQQQHTSILFIPLFKQRNRDINCPKFQSQYVAKIKVNTCYFISKHIHLFIICVCSKENEVRTETTEEVSLEFDQESGQNFSSGGKEWKRCSKQEWKHCKRKARPGNKLFV